MNSKFGVTTDGNVYMTGAHVKGDIYADSGTFNGTIYAANGEIGGWKITTNELYSDNVHLRSSSGNTTRAIEVNGGTFYVQNNG